MPIETIELPTLYGDHHVLEIRRLLFDLPGVEDVYASSCFHLVEVQYDDAALTPDQIRTVLDEAGYMGELPMPAETGRAATENGGQTWFRHTAVFEQTGQVVNFGQTVPYNGRPLWPCPGIGPIVTLEEEPAHG
ncbi:MAG TPA: copper chaperone [Anaerolineae bacterium]|nr:copper chaperone [Anaerolineae bacterium]HIP73915.1 copper chaperone [Anaerolineae bacterium]